MLVGTFWESHVFGQILRQAANRAETAPIGYWRTAGGSEVDMVIERAGALTAIECKWTEHPRPADADRLKTLEAAEPGRVKQKMIVCRTKVPFRLPDGTWVSEYLRCSETVGFRHDERGIPLKIGGQDCRRNGSWRASGNVFV